MSRRLLAEWAKLIAGSAVTSVLRRLGLTTAPQSLRVAEFRAFVLIQTRVRTIEEATSGKSMESLLKLNFDCSVFT